MSPVAAVHAGVGFALDVLLWPLAGLSPELQSLALGLPGALLALAVYRLVANQQAIETAKDRMKAHLLELRLFRDDLVVLLRAQGAFLRHNAVYLGHSLRPMAVLLLPFALLLVEVEARFGWDALPPGESVLLTAELDAPGRIARLPVALEPGEPARLRADTEALRIQRTHQVVWRLAAGEPGESTLRVRIGDHDLALRAVVGRGPARVSPAILRADQFSKWLVPTDPPLAAGGPVRSLHLDYPRHGGDWLGLSRASWLFVAATVAFAFALKGRFGVAI